MKICILGGLGHIGSGFIFYMKTRYPDFFIKTIDNLSTSKYHSLFGQMGRNYNFVELDARDSNLSKHLQDCDLVFHFAAITKAYDLSTATKLFEHNMAVTKNVVDACEKTGATLIFLSSTSTYEGNSGVVDELSKKLRPINLYAKSKFYEEKYVLAYDKSKVLRLGTIHGVSPGMNFHTVVNKFCWEIVNKHPVPIWKNVAQIRSPYLSLKNLIKVLEKIIKQTTDFTSEKTFNLVSHNSTPLEIFFQIKEIIPKAEYALIEGLSERTLDLEVKTKHEFLAPFLESMSLRSDLIDTFRLFYDKEFNWKEHFENL